MKISVNVCKNILSHLINSSLKYGIFPENLKVALIKPLYKKGDPESMDSYRPINLLPAFSKLFEMVMSERLTNFMQECNLFCESQHGYLRGKSTKTAIFEFVKAVVDHFENGNLALGMFLDLSKAYDCLNRELLIKKLEMYGIRGNAHRWLVSYINNRVQTVSVVKDGKVYRSKFLKTEFGIAQGSVLGPILFIIFVNDLNNATDLSKRIIKYADDTNLLSGGSNLTNVLNEGKNFFDTVNKWFIQNRLIMNESKTNVILFKTKQSKVDTPMYFENSEHSIPFTQHAKFLGIYINEFLDWTYHIGCLSKKLRSICYGIRITSKYMNEKTLKCMNVFC